MSKSYALVIVIMFCLLLGVIAKPTTPSSSPNPNTVATQQTPSQENAAKKETGTKEASSSPKPAVTREQMTEMGEAFNDLESNNKYSTLYSGVECRVKADGGQRIIVSVNDSWNDLSKDMKIGYVNHVASVWAGMHGARGLAFDLDKFDVTFKHDESGRTVATWGNFMGPSIKD